MSSKIDALLTSFKTALLEPWGGTYSGAERTWFLVHDPADVRRLTLRLGDFELATRQAGYEWRTVSLRAVFPAWLSQHPYAEAYFADPEVLADQLEGAFVEEVRAALEAALLADGPPDARTLVVLTDTTALFGLARLADVIQPLAEAVPGRLLVLFPGEHAPSQYHLLGAAGGWNYLARPIAA